MNAQPSQPQARPAAPAAKPAAQVAPATLSISFVDSDGWPMTLTLTAPSGLAVIDAAQAAKKKLVAVGATPAAAPVVAAAADQAGEAAPICAIHKKPMTKVNGKKGAFWSCHEKLEDGSFCPYRPAAKN